MDQATSTTHAVAATAITFGGMTTGLSYEVLLAGFAGSLVALSYLESLGVWRRLWSIVTSTVTAGYAAPIAEGGFRYLFPDIAAGAGGLIASGFVLGVTAQALIPGAFALIKRRAEADPNDYPNYPGPGPGRY